MRWEQQIQYASLSDIGFRRRNNQDSCAVQVCKDQTTWKQSGHLFVIADGMGGHAVGELASKIAVDTLPHTYFKTTGSDIPQALKASIEKANNTIYERGSQNRDFERMGTTCSSLVLSPQGAIIGHVGDSRVYRIRDERIDQLSFDHSLQWELLRQGKMDPEDIFLHEPRHVITRSLGPEQAVQVDIEGPYAILPGDTYLLCSDGLTGHLNDAEIGMIARNLEPGDACRLLVNLANLRGGSDNITVIIARVGELPEGLEPFEEPDTSPVEAGLNWMWLIGFWVIAIMFVGGVSLALFSKYVEGVLLVACSVFALVAALFAIFHNRPPKNMPEQSSDTTIWRPYRTASAKLQRKFLSHLAALESELQRTATEEGWSINWSEHETAFHAAKRALAEEEDEQALAAFSKTLSVLMSGVLEHRKQIDRELKWGKNHPSTSKSSTD